MRPRGSTWRIAVVFGSPITLCAVIVACGGDDAFTVPSLDASVTKEADAGARSDAAPPATAGPCITVADCPAGYLCGWPLDQGCAATAGICVLSPDVGLNLGEAACGCDGGAASVDYDYPEGYNSTPVAGVLDERTLTGPVYCDDMWIDAAPPPSTGTGGTTAPCTSDSDCQVDLVCGYELRAGCTATSGTCVPRQESGSGGIEVCTCDGGLTYLSSAFPDGYGPSSVAGLLVLADDFGAPASPTRCVAFAEIEADGGADAGLDAD